MERDRSLDAKTGEPALEDHDASGKGRRARRGDDGVHRRYGGISFALFEQLFGAGCAGFAERDRHRD